MVGAGNRGKVVYGNYALNHPQDLKFVAIAEPHPLRRELFARAHNIPSSNQYSTWEDLLQSKVADAAFICTQDQMHTAPAIKALELGYNVLLEKPMATKINECIALTQKAQGVKKQLRIAHVLRYTPFFQKIYDQEKKSIVIMPIQTALSFVIKGWQQASKNAAGDKIPVFVFYEDYMRKDDYWVVLLINDVCALIGERVPSFMTNFYFCLMKLVDFKRMINDK